MISKKRTRKISHKHLTKVKSLKKKCDMIDKQLWQLNWKYNKLIAELRAEIIKIALEHGKIDKSLYIKVKNLFLDNPETEFKNIFMDVKHITFEEQLKQKLETVQNAIKYFNNMENKNS